MTATPQGTGSASHLPGAPVVPQEALLQPHHVQEERFGQVVQGVGSGQVRKEAPLLEGEDTRVSTPACSRERTRAPVAVKSRAGRQADGPGAVGRRPRPPLNVEGPTRLLQPGSLTLTQPALSPNPPTTSRQGTCVLCATPCVPASHCCLVQVLAAPRIGLPGSQANQPAMCRVRDRLAGPWCSGGLGGRKQSALSQTGKLRLPDSLKSLKARECVLVTCAQQVTWVEVVGEGSLKRPGNSHRGRQHAHRPS